MGFGVYEALELSMRYSPSVSKSGPKPCSNFAETIGAFTLLYIPCW